MEVKCLFRSPANPKSVSSQDSKHLLLELGERLDHSLYLGNIIVRKLMIYLFAPKARRKGGLLVSWQPSDKTLSLILEKVQIAPSSRHQRATRQSCLIGRRIDNPLTTNLFVSSLRNQSASNNCSIKQICGWEALSRIQSGESCFLSQLFVG
jgi:hypothetical protein